MKQETTDKPKRIVRTRCIGVLPKHHSRFVTFCSKRNKIIGREAEAALEMYMSAVVAEEQKRVAS